MDGNTNSFGIRGFLIDTPGFGALRGRPTGALIIDNGRITERGDYDVLRRVQRWTPIRWIDHGNAAIFPGLIDCHTHLPQYPAVAGGESKLLPWLRQHIFPVEREFTGPKARDEAPQFFRELARNGTTTVIGTLDGDKEADFIVVDLASLLPYPKNREALGELSSEDALALCIYQDGPQANLETYVRGKCIYQGPALAQSS
jgi:cytosine/adenosine deaminase-related metal-dependent hydrolase